MKKKIKNLWKTLLLCTALTVTSCVTPVMAAQADDTEDSTPEEPAKPESYDWEIQSNKIPGWPQGPKVVAETAILMDMDSGSILYAKGIDEKRAPASTTKIMTAMLALEQVPFDTEITFTDEVHNIEADSTHIGIKPGETLTMKDSAYAILLASANEVSSGVAEYIGGTVQAIEADSTHIGIKPGETLTMKDSAYAILLASANEVSSGVAEYIGGTVQAFVDSMNQRAKDLGCENTHFVNANGLYHEDHYTTARDLAIISCTAFQNETFREIIKTPYYIVPATNITNETRWLNNHHYTTARDLAIISCTAFQNETFREIIKTPYYIVPATNITNETRWLNNHHKMVLPDRPEYYEGCLGGKTGYTEKAGNTLVTYAERDGMRLVCVVLADINEHYNDTKALFDYGFQNFQKTAPQAETFSATKNDTLGAKLLEQGILAPVFQDSSLIVPKEQKETLSFQTTLEEDNTLLVTYRYGETVLGNSSLPATDEILAAAKELGIRKEAVKQGNMTFQKESEEKETDITPDSSKETGSSSPKGLVHDMTETFHELPNWKGNMTFQKESEEKETDITPDSSKETGSSSPKGLVHDMTETFHELPNWKYPALLFIAAAMIFYIVTLSVRIRRSHKRRKKNKKRKKGEF